jgi:EmrB/QacA subfamily drug resistance transporter
MIMRSLTNDVHPDRRRWIALAVVLTAQVMMVLDTTVVNVALPAIGSDLGFAQADLTWVVNGYLVTYGSFILVAGRLGDLLGRRRVFLVGVAVFTLASAACGLAGDQTVLIVARLVQGVGGALSSAAVLAIIVTEFPKPDDRAKAMSTFMFVNVAGGSLGLLLGGLLVQVLDWHWIFFINVPIGVVVMVMAQRLLDPTPGIGLGDGVDVLGAILVTAAALVGIDGIVLAADDGWLSLHTLGFVAISLVLLGLFFWREATASNPIFPLRMLRIPSLMKASVIQGLMVNGMYAAFFFGALYLEEILHAGTLETGAAFLPQTLTVAVLSLGVTARLMRRFGPRRVLLGGMSVLVVGLLLLATAGASTTYFPTLFVAFVLVGLGAGTAFVPLLTLALSDVPPEDAGLGSGIVNVSLRMSAALGLAVLGSVAASRTHALASGGDTHAAALSGGFQLGFLIAAGCTAVAIVVAALTVRNPPAPATAEEVVEATAEAEAVAV